MSENPKVELTVNGKKIGLNPFAMNIIGSGILGMMRSLKGIDEPEEVNIKITAS